MTRLVHIIVWALLLVANAGAYASWTVRYQHTDTLGSVIAESNTQGTITQRFDYKPFGEGTPTQKSGLGYTGHLEDTDLGLTYMQQRYYDPVIGRFYSNDPVDMLGHMQRGNPTMGFNRYAYGNNNPYKYTDPDGKFIFIAIAAVGAAITAYDTYQTYKNEGLGAAAKSLAVDSAITVATGGVGKLAHKAYNVYNSTKVGAKGASGTLTTTNGNKYTGNSTGSSATGGSPRAPMQAETQAALENVQKPSRTHGHCCEIDAINKALEAGDDVAGATMGPVKLNESGRVLPPCSTCREVMSQLGVKSGN